MFGSFKFQRRIEELEESYIELKRKFQALQLEWSDVLDKLNRKVGRLAKTAAWIEKHDEEATEATESRQDAPGSTPGDGVDPSTSHLDPISAKILARRKRGLLPG